MDKLKTYVNSVGLGVLAKRLGVSPQRLANWQERGVPLDYCSAVEAESDQVVMRWDLRPEDWHRIWPELVAVPGAPAIVANYQAREVVNG